MISVAVAALVMAPVQTYSVETTFEMLKKIRDAYDNKLCAAGTITLTLTVPDQDQMVIETQLQYLKPGRIFVSQVQKIQNGKSRFMVSDGKVFKYAPPKITAWTTAKDYYVELVKKKDGKFQTTEEMYLAAAQNILDRSIPLDCVMSGGSGAADAGRLMTESARMKDEVIGGETCEVYTGRFKPGNNNPAIFWFEMAIKPNGEIKRYRTQETHTTDAGAAIKMNFTWDVNVAVNDESKINHKLFVVP